MHVASGAGVVGGSGWRLCLHIAALVHRDRQTDRQTPPRSPHKPTPPHPPAAPSLFLFAGWLLTSPAQVLSPFLLFFSLKKSHIQPPPHSAPSSARGYPLPVAVGGHCPAARPLLSSRCLWPHSEPWRCLLSPVASFPDAQSPKSWGILPTRVASLCPFHLPGSMEDAVSGKPAQRK